MMRCLSRLHCTYIQKCCCACSSESEAPAPSDALEPGPESLPEHSSGFKWPWQFRAKPGGAVRQQPPSKGLGTNPGTSVAKDPGRTPASTPGLDHGAAVQSSQTGSDVTSQSQPGWGRIFTPWTPTAVTATTNQQSQVMSQSDPSQLPQSQIEAGAGCHVDFKGSAGSSGGGGPKNMALQANGLADKAMGRIAAAQHAMATSPSAALQSSHPIPTLSTSCEASTLGRSPRKRNGAASPVSPRTGAFSSPSSPQHNSRLRLGGTKSDKLRQLIDESSAQRQESGHDSELAQATCQDPEAGQGRSEQTGAGLWQPGKAAAPAGQGILAGQGSVAQPPGPHGDDRAEGRQHAHNPGSQAAALHNAAAGEEAADEASRYPMAPSQSQWQL